MFHTAIRRCAVTVFSVASLGLPSPAEPRSPQALDPPVTSAAAVLPKGKSAAALVHVSGTDVAEETSADVPWTRVYIKDAFTGDAARGALRAASRRLAKPACQSVLSEFSDERGLPLTEKLRELGVSPEGYLRLIVFLDGGGSPQCAKSGVLAFTSRNSRVVYLCGRDFERAARRDPRETQITLVHELLHTLGLGENPPSPRDISFRVLQRCSE
jgi:hypothetical protein